MSYNRVSMNIKICCITSNPQIDFIKSELEKLGTLDVYNKQRLTASEVVEIAKEANVLIAGSSGIEKISKELIDQLPNLRLIATLTVGVSWIDVAYAKSKGILISNIKGANSESVAEHTWGMILDLAKRITEFDRDTRYKEAFAFNPYKGKEVYGKTLGIFGLGDIGQKVARIAKGFDMKVLGTNKSNNTVAGVTLVSKEDLLKNSDIIAVCLPLNEETKNFISTDEIALMKDGVILVNCAMEEVVNKNAVLEGLKNKKVFGYGIETTIMVKVDANDPYYDYPNVVLTPHNAFNTEDADKKSYLLVLDNIRKFVEGNPQNIV